MRRPENVFHGHKNFSNYFESGKNVKKFTDLLHINSLSFLRDLYCL